MVVLKKKIHWLTSENYQNLHLRSCKHHVSMEHQLVKLDSSMKSEKHKHHACTQKASVLWESECTT